MYNLKALPKRPNKNAAGCLYTDARRQKSTGLIRISNPRHPEHNPEQERIANTLNVRGTTDHLRGLVPLYAKAIQVKHPTDFGYAKTVYVLTEKGKRRLKTVKGFRERKFPLWEYMYNNKPNF